MRKNRRHWGIACATAVLTFGMSMVAFGATGWSLEGDDWVYYDSDGSRVIMDWKKSGNDWFYLDESGDMAKSRLIEDDGNYYYVNSVGARVSNEWRELENEDDYEMEDTCWYYFGSTGRAYKASESGRTSFKTITKANGEVRKYTFDDQGRMLYGWIDESGQRQTGEDAWKTGIYYCGEPSDGARVDNDWRRLEAENSEIEDYDFDGTHWFYFGSTGKKLADTQKTINKGRYLFDENGAALYSWHEAIGTPSDAFYNLPSQCWRSDEWFKAVPSEAMNSEAYDDGEEKWFYYSRSQKDLLKSQIKSINNYSYGFNENGEMLSGLYKLKVEDKKILDYQMVEGESDLPVAGDDWKVYYFGNSPKEGSMALGRTNLTIDGERYTYFFRKSGEYRGAGVEGIYDGSIYEQGKLLKADRDLRYQGIEFEDDLYLVNTSGKIQKGKKNLRDGDGTYYSTDAKGIVIYTGDEKQ